MSFKRNRSYFNHTERSLSIGVLLLICTAFSFVSAGQREIIVGPQYIDEKGTLAVVIERPLDAAIATSHFKLVVDDRVVGPADRLIPFRDSGELLAIVLCVDVSGSMKQAPLIEIQQALNFLVANARPEDRFALMSFADDSRVESSFGDSREQLETRIRELQTRGKLSRIYEALNNATRLFEGSDIPNRRRVIIVSDGKDEGSRDDSEATIINFLQKGIVIDSVGRGTVDQLGRILELLSQGTGGQFEHAQPARLSVKDALSRIYTFLLEARSMVACFEYHQDPSRALTGDAYIEIEQSGELPLRVGLSIPVPRPHPIPPRQWPFFLVGLFLIALLAVFIVRRWRKKPEPEISPNAENGQVFIAPPEIMAGDPPERAEATQLSGYFFPSPERGQPAAVLVGIDGPVIGLQIPIDKSPYSIGASEKNDLCIDVDDYVSREHAYLRYQQGSLFVFDCGSSNATYVNQQKVAGTGLVLNIGDHIRLGQSIFEIAKIPG